MVIRVFEPSLWIESLLKPFTGGQLLKSTGHAQTVALGEARIDRAIKDGSAKRKFMDIATYQGADRHTVESLFKPDANLSAILPSAKDITHITSDESGKCQDKLR